MAIQFHELPVDEFPDNLRPHIARLNRELRELFGLEGAMRNPIQSSRSDATVVRRAEPTVDISRITPSVATVASGASTVTGVPALTLGTANVAGSTSTAISTNSAIALFGTAAPANLATAAAVGTSAFAARGDHVHKFPTTLQSTANNSTLALTDDGVDQTLTGSLGTLTVQPGATGNMHLVAPGGIYRFATVAGGQTINLDVGGGASLITVNMDPDSGHRTGIVSNWSGGNVTSDTVRCWDARYNSFSGVWTTATIVGFDTSAFTLVGTTGSDSSNKGYCARLSGPLINSTNIAGWSEVSALFIEAPRRSLSNPIVSLAASILAECPTVSGTTQLGLYLKQRTAQQTATNRIGILVDAQNSGTNRWGAYIRNRVYIESPSGQTNTVLSLSQLQTGAAAGAHINLDDKAGDPPSPVTGDIWRNGDALNFRHSTATVNLATAGSGDNVSVNGSAASDADFDDAFPVAPGSYMNVRWQKGSSSPNDISAYWGKDVNGNTMITVNPTVSADRYIEFQNATNASGVGPAIYALGNGTDIDLRLYPKGDGVIVGDAGLRMFSRSAPPTGGIGSSYTFLYAAPEDSLGRLYNEDANGVTQNLCYLKRVVGLSGAAGAHLTWQRLTANSIALTTTGLSTIMTTTSVGSGTYAFKYSLIYGSSETTTGVGFAVNHTGTVGTFVSRTIYTSTGNLGASGTADDITGTTLGLLVEGKAERVINTVTTTTGGVEVANVNHLSVLEGVMVVTASGDMELKARSEVSGSTIVVMANSCLELKKIA